MSIFQVNRATMDRKQAFQRPPIDFPFTAWKISWSSNRDRHRRGIDDWCLNRLHGGGRK